MKKLISAVTITIAIAASFAANADVTKMDGLLRSALSRPASMKSILGKAVVVTAEKESVNCLLKSSDTQSTTAAIEGAGGEVRAVVRNIMSVSIPSDALEDISNREEVLYIEAARLLAPKMNFARSITGVEDVQEGVGLDKAYNGSGVFVGAVDNTIDWQHPDFSGSDGKTRICYLNQKTVVGTTIECSKTEIDDNNCQVTQGGAGYHGTHVTGIAAGANSTYTGVAPQSMIAFAFNSPSDAEASGSFSTTVLEGVSAIFGKADTYDMPSVINLSLGTSWGAHDDTSLLEQGLNEATLDSSGDPKAGRVIVNAAGNENVNANDNAENGNLLGGIHAELNESVTNRGWKIVIRSSQIANYYDAGVIDVWLDNTTECRNSTIEVKAYKRDESNTQTANDKLNMTAINFTADNTSSKTTTDGNVTVEIDTFTSNAQNSRPEALVFMGPSAVGRWSDITTDTGYFFDVVIRVPSGTCKGDMWLYPDQTLLIDFIKGYAGTVVTGTGSYQLADGDSLKTMTIPATASGVIAVGSFMGRGTWTDINGVVHNQTDYDLSLGETGGTVGNISLFSSLGPTGEVLAADQRIKPDLVAPGEPIISTKASAQSFQNALLGDSTHVKLEGTSMSSPHVTGSVALMLGKNNCLTAPQVKNYLTSTATSTGTNPNNVYGYGKLNALAAMQAFTSDLSCYKGTSCGGSSDGGGGCGSTLVPVAAGTGLASIIAVVVPIGIIISRRRK